MPSIDLQPFVHFSSYTDLFTGPNVGLSDFKSSVTRSTPNPALPKLLLFSLRGPVVVTSEVDRSPPRRWDLRTRPEMPGVTWEARYLDQRLGVQCRSVLPCLRYLLDSHTGRFGRDPRYNLYLYPTYPVVSRGPRNDSIGPEGVPGVYLNHTFTGGSEAQGPSPVSVAVTNPPSPSQKVVVVDLTPRVVWAVQGPLRLPETIASVRRVGGPVLRRGDRGATHPDVMDQSGRSTDYV